MLLLSNFSNGVNKMQVVWVRDILLCGSTNQFFTLLWLSDKAFSNGGCLLLLFFVVDNFSFDPRSFLGSGGFPFYQGWLQEVVCHEICKGVLILLKATIRSDNHLNFNLLDFIYSKLLFLQLLLVLQDKLLLLFLQHFEATLLEQCLQVGVDNDETIQSNEYKARVNERPSNLLSQLIVANQVGLHNQVIAQEEEADFVHSLQSAEKPIFKDQTVVEVTYIANRSHDEQLQLNMWVLSDSEGQDHKDSPSYQEDNMVGRSSHRLNIHLLVHGANLLSLAGIAKIRIVLVKDKNIEKWQKSQNGNHDDREYSLAQGLPSLEVDKSQRRSCGDEHLKETGE